MAKTTWNMPSSGTDIKEIKATIASTSSIFDEINARKEELNDIFDDLHSKYDMPRRVFNALCKFNYYGNANATKERAEEITDAWEAIENVSCE